LTRFRAQYLAVVLDAVAQHALEPGEALLDLGLVHLVLHDLDQPELVDLAGGDAQALQHGGQVPVAGLHAHRVAAVEAEDLVADGGDGLGGAEPVGHLGLDLVRAHVADDAVGAHAGLAQGAVGGQQADVAGELAVVIRQAQDRHVTADGVDERPGQEGEVPDVVAHDERAAAGAAQLLADLLGDAGAGDDLAGDDDLGRRAVDVLEFLSDDVGPLLDDAHVFGVILAPDMLAFVVEHGDADGRALHRAPP